MEPTATYRSDIDGLRALAVLLVLAFHLEPRLVPGGYIGVDVFFVISGYLITGILHRELAAKGGVDFRAFYLKRARRLLPALLATIFLTLVSAVLLLPSSGIRSVAIEAAAAATFTSNILFWWQDGYFDAASVTKPLLHTWSLGVEGQFYLFWPFLLLAIWRSNRLLTLMIAGVLVASLAGSVLASFTSNTATAFYLTPFRAFEFSLGALLALHQDRSRPTFKAGSIIFVTALAVVIVSSFWFTAHTPWPSFLALLPSVGAALTIWSGPGIGNYNPLSHPVAKSLGQASYAIYLAHWPVIVFGRELLGPGVHATVALLLASLILGYGIHFAVERRFYVRTETKRSPARPFLLGTMGGLAMVGAFSATAYSLNQPPIFNGVTAEQIVSAGRSITWLNHRKLDRPFDRWASGKQVLLVGDSQGGDLVNLLLAADPRIVGNLRTFPSSKGCQIKLVDAFFDDPEVVSHPDYIPHSRCSSDISRFRADERLQEADIIILAYAWIGPSTAHIEREISEIEALAPQAEIFVAGKKDMAASSIEYFEATNSIALSNEAAFQEIPSETLAFNQWAGETIGNRFLNQLSFLCDESTCNIFTTEGFPVLHDARHFTDIALEAMIEREAVKKTLSPLLPRH